MSRQVVITIDGRKITAAEGERLLWAALENGIYIPHLCAVKEQERPAAGCRLCFVEVQGICHPVTACTQAVKEGMVVKTRTPAVDRLVRTAFELLLSEHNLNCGECPQSGYCELQRIAGERGLKLKLQRLKPLPPKGVIDDSPRSFIFDSSRCVLCGRCVWVDHHLAGVGAIGFSGRAIHRRVTTFEDRKLAQSPCTECGLCVQACPVGALYSKEKDPNRKADHPPS